MTLGIAVANFNGLTLKRAGKAWFLTGTEMNDGCQLDGLQLWEKRKQHGSCFLKINRVITTIIRVRRMKIWDQLERRKGQEKQENYDLNICQKKRNSQPISLTCNLFQTSQTYLQSSLKSIKKQKNICMSDKNRRNIVREVEG